MTADFRPLELQEHALVRFLAPSSVTICRAALDSASAQRLSLCSHGCIALHASRSAGQPCTHERGRVHAESKAVETDARKLMSIMKSQDQSLPGAFSSQPPSLPQLLPHPTVVGGWGLGWVGGGVSTPPSLTF